jgi:PAS domain S-box-containing protein
MVDEAGEYPRQHSAKGDDGARTTAILQAALDCIITMDHEGRVIEFNPAAERTFGYRRAEVIGQPLAELIIPPALRQRHQQGMARYLSTGETSVLGRRIEVTAMRFDQTEFPVELAITRIAGDGPPVFTAYLRDISDRVRAERLRNVRYAVTQKLTQGTGVVETLTAVLGAVCEQLRWDFGAFWCADREGKALQCMATWSGRGAPVVAFEGVSRSWSFGRGQGLPGQVWASNESAWVLDVRAEDNFPRAGAAAAASLRSAFACPIVVGEHALGVIEFFTQQLRDPDAELLETMGTVAGHVGQFIERRQAEDRLRESEARFRALMDQAPFSMQMFAPEGRTVRVNPAWSQLWGVTLDQIADYNVLQDPQLEKKGVLAYLHRAFAGEAVAIPAIRYDPNETIPERSRHADPVRYVSAVAYPLKDEVGRVQEVVLVHEDITARMRAESALRESEEKLRLLADTIPQLAWMAEPDGYIFWYNRRWYEYTGTSPHDMEGWGWQSVHDPDMLSEVLARWKASIATGQPFDMVFPLRAADGSFRSFLTRVNPLREPGGSILYWFGTNTDISEMKRMEDALREADRRKDEFLATLAHELRNPLAPIVNSLQLLKMPSIDAAMAERTRDVMERQVRHLVRLVDDLLDVARVVRGKIELRKETVDLASVVARAVETAQSSIDARGHRLELALTPQPLVVEADPVRLAQVVANLLTNSAKYTEPYGRIIVSTRPGGDEAVLSVEDNGIGIAPEVLPRVFDSFVQGDQAAARSEGGLGIGLTLVKTLVELHGGTVEGSSPGVGKGARFTIRLPLAAEQSPTAVGHRNSIPDPPAPRQRILVVDDNREAADTLAALLRLQAHDVRVAYDGLSAIEAAAAHRPTVVFLDIGMPGMDGYEAARRIRLIPGMNQATLVAVTGWGQEDDRRRSAGAGFDHHIVKPPELTALLNILAVPSRSV